VAPRMTTIAMSLALVTCSAPPSVLEQIIESGTLTFVTRQSPTTYYPSTDEPRGIEYELAKGFADRLGVKLDIYVADQFWQIFPDLMLRRADIAAAGLTVTEPRKEIVDFSPPYQYASQHVIYRRGTRRPYSIVDLYGSDVEILAGSAYVGTLEDARREHPTLEWTENADVDIEELVRRVAAGELRFTLVDSNIFEHLQHAHPDARVGFEIKQDIPIAWALPKVSDSSLREAVSGYFAEATASGALSTLIDRYRLDDIDKFDYVGSRAFVNHVKERLPTYRSEFQAAADRMGFDWRLLAALAYQESNWDPVAVSPTGVRGMMMLTRQTASMMGVADRVDPRQSILGGAAYLAHVRAKLPARIPEPHRTWLAVAAYNIGFGHLEDARIITQAQGGNPDDWSNVRERLPLLSEPQWFERVRRGYARGEVAALYVENVRRYFEILSWLTADELFTEQERPRTDDRDIALQAG
jgi:membrane-bound lytic murein transglycosylase F